MKTKEIKEIERVLDRLKNPSIHLGKLLNCELLQLKRTFLSYIITNEGLGYYKFTKKASWTD